MIYLDNASTSWPKPPGVSEAMVDFLNQTGANPGRGGHRLAIEAGRTVDTARQVVAELFNAADPLRVTFGHNVTAALNFALHGLLKPGDHVITSSIEHNSMMRPLRELESRGVRVTVVACHVDGTLDPQKIEDEIRAETALVALNHASNVMGTILPVAEVGEVTRRRGIPLLVDAATTAGAMPIDVEEMKIDLLAFTGHKGLGGPTGTGGLIIGEQINHETIRPLIQGGTGSYSEQERQPAWLPDALESGTLNVVGLAGLTAAVKWIRNEGLVAIRKKLLSNRTRLTEGLQAIRGITIHGSRQPEMQTTPIAFSISSLSPSEAGCKLDDQFGILCRVGLHCSPAAHKTIQTFPVGTLRFAPGLFTSDDEIETTLSAVRQLVGGE